MNRWQQLARHRLWDMGAVMIGLLAIIKIAVILPERATRNDFAHYYTSGWAYRTSEHPYAVDLAPWYSRFGLTEYNPHYPKPTNPPPLLRLLSLLSWFRPRTAFVVWVGMEMASLALIGWLTRHLLRGRLSPRGWLLAGAATLASLPVYYNFTSSQVQLPLAALVLAAYALRRAGKHTTACLLVAGAGVLKLYPLVLLPWFLWRVPDNRRCRWWRTVGVGLMLSVAVLATGPALWRDFFSTALGRLQDIARIHPYNYCPAALLKDVALLGTDAVRSPVRAAVGWELGVIVGLALMAWSYVVALRARGEEEVQFSLLTTGMLLSGMTVWDNYFVFLIFPVTMVATRLLVRPRFRPLIGFCLLLLALNWLDVEPARWVNCQPMAALIVHYIPLYGLVGLFAFLARERPGPAMNQLDAPRRCAEDGCR